MSDPTIKNNKYLYSQIGSWPFVVFLAVGMFHVLRVIGWFSAMPLFVGDGKFDAVLLEHIYLWVNGVTHTWHGLWSPQFFYPFEGMLAFSNNNFGSAAGYVVLRMLGVDRYTAFSGWFFLGYLLNFIATYFVLRRLGFKSFSAAAGAYVYTFALPVVSMEFWGSLNYRFAIPMAFLSFWLIIKNKQVQYVSHLAFWTMWQFYCSIYLGVFLAYLLLGVLIAYWVTYKESPFSISKQLWFASSIRANSVNLLLSLVYLCLIVLLLAQYHHITYGDYHFSRPLNEVSSYLPRFADYLPNVVEAGYQNHGIILFDGYAQPRYLFLGFGVYCMMFYSLWVIFYKKINYALGKTLAILLLLLFLVTIRIGDYSLYYLLATLPGISAMRVMFRIILVMLLPISILVSIACEHYLYRFEQARVLRKFLLNSSMVTLLSIEVCFSIVLSTPIREAEAYQSSLEKKLPASITQNSIIFVGPEMGATIFAAAEAELDGMILAQTLNLPTLNGYTGFYPPNTRMVDACISYKDRLIAYAHFRHKPDSFFEDMAKHVVVISSSHPCSYEPLVISDDIISAHTASQITFEVQGSVVGKQFTGHVLITNNSPKPFNTLSHNGDLQFLWRFLPLFPRLDENTHTLMPEPVWVVKQIPFTIAPGASRVQPLLLDVPSTPGKYRLVVSMVQPGGIWFHTSGMDAPHLDVQVVKN